MSNPPNQTISLQYITLEEHFDPEAIVRYETDPVYKLLVQDLGDSTIPLLHDINGSRLDSMNVNGIRIQVVSNDPTPGAIDKPDGVRAANDELSNKIKPYPDRFRGFCFLPMAYPQLAAEELNRCIMELGFVGALVDSHLPDYTSYDSPSYNVLWETFESLDVPIYLHPTYPPIREVNETGGLYTASNHSYPDTIASYIGTAGWGWHSDCGTQFLKLWMSGVFDRYPNMKIVLGHMGEMLPYMLSRSNSTLSPAKTTGASLAETYENNVWITTSGFFSLDPFATVLGTTAKDRIMYSVDYPWATNENGRAFMEALKSSSMVTEEEWEGIAFRNAEILLEIS